MSHRKVFSIQTGYACITIGIHQVDVEVELTIEVEAADTSVGMMYDSYKIIECEVQSINEFQRAQHEGDDDNWFYADKTILMLIESDPDLHESALESAAENAAE